MANNFVSPKEDPKKGNTTIEDIIKVAESLIALTRQKILINFRFFDVALSSLKYKAEPVESMAMNGETLFYNPLYVISRYNSALGRSLSREILHVIMHCVLKHNLNVMHLDPDLWNLACDIAVEDVIYSLGYEFLENSADIDEGRRKIITSLKSSIKNRKGQSVNYLSAETLYRYFKDEKPSYNNVLKMAAIFKTDDHILWYIPKPEEFGGNGFSVVKNDDGKILRVEADPNSSMKIRQSSMGEDEESNGQGTEKGDSPSQSTTPGGGESYRERLERIWTGIAERMKIDLETMSKDIGSSAGSLFQNVAEVTREKYDYTSFLKKFAVRGEVMKINDDEFDYVFYTYGLKLYDNVPLIEPLEYKEEKRIRDFAIIIDTSGSVQGKEVQAFLNKTYNILKSEESFHKKINIHIIQCDAEVQEDYKLNSREEFDEYLKKMTLKGFGGTDFRPALKHVEDLIENKEFTNLKGVIYFTDCYGVFPEKKPPFETAFVVVSDENDLPNVPSWAIRLELRYDDLKE